MTTIGNNIRKLRESAGMSQDQLGTKINKTRSAISQYESGKIIPRMGVIEDMAHVFNVPKSEIIGEILESDSVQSLTIDERELLELWGNMSLEQRAAFLHIGRTLVSDNQ